MGWFTAKPDDGDASAAATISDKEWRKLQDRALKANPAQRSMFTEESRRAAVRGQANYRNRRWC
ncbi:hypothetical protein DMP17_22330 [Pseudonocardia sp. TMWB2A]|uniref:hypothetical protein n=1 Tax=Pseudonocardia sp. TMWB2A TaxID=687430 RepID=UPI00307E9EB1